MRKFALLLTLILVPLAFAASAAATPPIKESFSFTSDPITLEGICSFPITVVSTVNATSITFLDKNGELTMVLNYVTEQDTFTANGKSLTGVPYTFELRFLFDEDGNLTHSYASGLAEKIVLPDGTLFISAGRVDFAAHPDSLFLISPDVGVSGDLEAFCGYFADP